MKLTRLFIVSLTCLVFSARAADPSPNELKLRESLRNTMLQLRNVEAEKATLQAAQTENEQKVKTLTEQNAALAKQVAADKEFADKTIAELKNKVTELQADTALQKETLAKWKDGFQKAADLAKKKEAERAKAAAEVITLTRRAEDRERKNRELFKVGSEILDRYEKFSLGEALAAKEPFTGLTRVKLESLVQGYQDKLLEQRITTP